MEHGSMIAIILAAIGTFTLIMNGAIDYRGEAVVKRITAFSFLGAGYAGLEGWLGRSIAWFMDLLVAGLNGVTKVFLGNSVAWVAIVFLVALWTISVLPDRLVVLPRSITSSGTADYLAISGLAIFPLLQSVPGPAGDTLVRLFGILGRFPAEATLRVFW